MKCYDEIQKASDELKLLNPNAHCTYHHPTGITQSGWVVHEWGKPISSYHQQKIKALNEAITKIKENNNGN